MSSSTKTLTSSHSDSRTHPSRSHGNLQFLQPRSSFFDELDDVDLGNDPQPQRRPQGGSQSHLALSARSEGSTFSNSKKRPFLSSTADSNGFNSKQDLASKWSDNTDEEALEDSDSKIKFAANSFSISSNSATALVEYRRRLPIASYRLSLLYALWQSRVLLVYGSPACGKTTQIPQYIFEAGWLHQRCMAVILPNPISVVSAAQRVSEEISASSNHSSSSLPISPVGYSVHLDSTYDFSSTRIHFLTCDSLLRMLLSDPLLCCYDILFFDEFHLRTFSSELLLGIAKKLLILRTELKIIICSSTLHIQNIRQYFKQELEEEKAMESMSLQKSQPSSPPATKFLSEINIADRLHPVTILYTANPVADYILACVETVRHILSSQHTRSSSSSKNMKSNSVLLSGDILVFLPGKKDIDQFLEKITDSEWYDSDDMNLLVLHSQISKDQQNNLFHFSQNRSSASRVRIIASTNLAESSVTVPNISFVIDCGLMKEKIFNPLTSVTSLSTLPISKASAIQRAGRAARQQAGIVYRLYTEADYSKLPDFALSDLQKSDLSSLLLYMKVFALDDVITFPFFSRPNYRSLAAAFEFLYSLRFIDNNARLADSAAKCAWLPVPMLWASALIESVHWKCVEEISLLCAIQSLGGIFLHGSSHSSVSIQELDRRRKKYCSADSDVISELNFFRTFSSLKTSQKKQKFCEKYLLKRATLDNMQTVANKLKWQLAQMMKLTNSQLAHLSTSDAKIIRQCICSAFFVHAAKYDGNVDAYRAVWNSSLLLKIHPSSMFYHYHPAWIVFGELVDSEQCAVKQITVVQPDWIEKSSKHIYQMKKNNWLAAETAPAFTAVRMAATADHESVVNENGRQVKHRTLF